MRDLWSEYVKLQAALDRLTESMPDSYRRANHVLDRQVGVLREILGEVELVESIREQATSATSAAERAAAAEFLQFTAVLEMEELTGLDTLYDNPVFGFTREEVDSRPVVLLFPDEPSLEVQEMRLEDELDLEDGIISSGRSPLARLGGPPTTIAGQDPHPGRFLLQIDFAELVDDPHDDVPPSLACWPSLPTDGLLQVFADQPVAGRSSDCGLSLRYLPENSLPRRLDPRALEHELQLRDLTNQGGFSFAALQEAQEPAVLERLAWLDDVVDEPFPTASTPLRLMGHLRHPARLDFTAGTHLNERLPLVDEDDQHLALLQVPAAAFPPGVLEAPWTQVWIRTSDLRRGHFDATVSTVL